MSYYIGVVGDIMLSPTEMKQAKKEIELLLGYALDVKNKYEDVDFDDSIYIVSGLIEKGVTKLAYEIADERRYKKVGIDSELAKDYDDSFKDFTTKYIKGKYGDEIEYFIRNIDILLVVRPTYQSNLKQKFAKNKGIPVLYITKTGKVGGMKGL